MPVRMGRPTKFATTLEMAKVAWAPVLKVLSQEDLANLDKIPYNPTRSKILSWKEYNVKYAPKQPPGRTWWPTPEQIIQIHDDMIREFGGTLGIINAGAVKTAVDRIRYSSIGGEDQYPTLFHKAAALMHSILLYHPFADGQKRTGLASAFVFLGMNGYTMWSKDYRSEVHFAIEIAKGLHEIDAIQDWVCERVGPARSLKGVRGKLFAQILGTQEVQGVCQECKTRIAVNKYRVYCKRCDIWYEGEIKMLVYTWDAKETLHTRLKAGLHKVPHMSKKGLTPEKLENLRRRRPSAFSKLRQQSLFDYDDS